MTCTHNHNCGCGSLSNANIKAVIEGLMVTAFNEKEFDVIELKNSIHNNLVKLGEVQDKLNDFKADMSLNLSAMLTKTELASIKSELENLIKQQQNIYEDLQRAFETNTNNKLLDYKSDILGIQREVAGELNKVQNQLASLVPTRDAYKVAVQNGYVGSEASWLDSLKGHSAYELAKAHGFKGSEAEWLVSLKGDKGPKGDKGDQGPAGKDGINGINGVNGKDGKDGLTAYELAKKNGYVGSEPAWLNSLIGEKGERGVGLSHISHNKDDTLTFLFTDNTSYTTKSLKGEQGIQGPEAKSVYDIAVSHGFKGDEKDWLNYILENSETVSDLFADADSLEKFVNGSDSETVLTRLSATYPTLQKALKEIFTNGGIAGRFKTLTLLKASALPDGSYALVADDTPENNGVYIKEGSSWVKSKYNLVTRDVVDVDSGGFVEVLKDKDGKTVRATTSDGHVYIPHLDGSIQDNFLNGNSYQNDDMSYLVSIEGVASRKVPLVDENGALYASDIIKTNANLSKDITTSDTVTEWDHRKAKADRLMATDYAIAARDTNRVNVNTVISDNISEGFAQTGSPAMTRIDKNKYFYVHNIGNNVGDYGQGRDSYVISYILVVNDDNTVSMTNKKTLLSYGSDDFGTFMKAEAQPFLVPEGKHKGRLYVYYLKRYSTKKDTPCFMYSDDLGETWSGELDFSVFIPNYEDKRLAFVSPANPIQIRHGKYKGRIVLPCWHATTNYPTSLAGIKAFLMYSDDGGETYQMGPTAEGVPFGNEGAVAEIDDNGTIIFIVRSEVEQDKWVCYSYDGGQTITPVKRMSKKDVHTGVIQSGLIQAKNDFDMSVPKTIITSPYGHGLREDVGIFISYDGYNFDLSAKLDKGDCLYSKVDIVDESRLLICFEQNDRKKIMAKVVNLKEIFMGGV